MIEMLKKWQKKLIYYIEGIVINIKKKLFLDADGCIFDTIDAIVKLYNQDFKYYKNYKYIYPYEINTWDFSELECATPEFINTYFNQQRFFDNLEYMDNAKTVLNRLKDKYDIVVVSMGYSPNLLGKSLFLRKHLPYAEFIGVNFKEYPNKAHINMKNGVAFVDDSYGNLVTSNCPNLICFGDVYPWNSENEAGEGYKRCYNWYELEKYLMELDDIKC